MWVDAALDFRIWGKVGAPHIANPDLKYTPDGYPLADADALSYLTNYPNGVYHLTWRGSGDVVVDGMGLESKVVRRGDQAMADVWITHEDANRLTGGMIYMRIRHNDRNNPVHDIHLWSPNAVPGEIYTADFLRRVRPFACIRFMDLAVTNNSRQVEWADRVQPANMIQTNVGVPWETIIELSNQTGRDIWINVPAMASDDYVRHLAQMFKERLKGQPNIRVEYSNEVWNGIFQQFGYNVERARANGQLTAKDDFGRAAQQYALRAKQIGDIFREVWQKDSARITLVLGAQASNNYWHETGLKYIAAHFGPPAKFFGEVAIAPYVGDKLGDVPAGGWTLDSLFAAMHRNMSLEMAQWTRDAKASADDWGLGLVAYEGGQNLTGEILPGPLVAAAQADPRMYTLYHEMVRTWRTNGGGLFCEFSHMGPSWGLLESSAQAGSPKWDAVMDMILPKGDANLDGKVDYVDFLILKSNWGRTPAWWEQGDFNGDGVVDAKDLDLLVKNLKDLTPEQKADVDNFVAEHRK